MLDTITKKRIDDCRDILVGKLPDPKAQIEQITIGLIYKFMADMDKEAVDLGGKAKFFSDYTIIDTNDKNKESTITFSDYSWDRLFDPKVTAVEMLRLYSEAIENMEKNPNIPQLFRDIFNNAYLPYRDPETLKLFLKTIGEFEYTHSEKLGDAFEYLLSVMGSQGDAGQFRTPRHIIDFLVAIVDPSKTDSIMDPACGTAGFLISAFKYIKEKNKNELTPDQRKKLIQNFVGYDISPDMVRLSLVNLYLHGFSDPHIFEYDTLSSEERWNENFDVILANPPFMSPKGGIRPHKKFTISSKRSEVLFVDYIAEHLNPNGRAGIIVPEGVIFQSGTAYKDLRKMLVENHLYAVVSLPAGVFNPYSGVKTSILFLDAALANKSKKVLFVKIDNDGYSLGSQRGEVKGGQLEEAIETAKAFKHSILEGTHFENATIAHSVDKTEIAKNGDYNLSGDRYKVIDILNSEYPIVELGSITNITTGKINSNAAVENGEYPFFTCSKEIYNIDNYAFDCEALLLAGNNAAGIFDVKHYSGKFNAYQRTYVITIKEKFETKVLYVYLKHLLERHLNLLKQNSLGSSTRYLVLKMITSLEIPLPPLPIQEEIVSEIEGYQKIIHGAKMVVDNYKPKIDIESDWEMVELGEIIKLSSGKGLTSKNMVEGSYPVYGGNGINGYHNKYFLEKPTIVIGRVGAYCGAIDITQPKAWITDNGLYVIKFLKEVEIKFLGQMLSQLNLNRFAKVGGQPSISQTTVTELSIALPTIEAQKGIVKRIENEQNLVNANKEIIEIFEQKIKDRIAKVWGE